LLFVVNKKRYPQITFLTSLYLNTYFAGALFATLVLTMPIIISIIQLHSIWLYLALIGCLLLITMRLTYSFWVTVQIFTASTLSESCMMHLKGWALFLILHFISIAWVLPLTLNKVVG